MAATLAPERESHSQTDEDLTDEQIEELLARATARLREESKWKDVVKLDEEQTSRCPKLETGKLEKPYISHKGDVATVDASRLLEEKHRKQASGVRIVEDPVAARTLAIEVCWHILAIWRLF